MFIKRNPVKIETIERQKSRKKIHMGKYINELNYL